MNPSKFKVTYIHTVEHTYEAIVEADSMEEAKRKLEDDMDFINEDEVGYQGLKVNVTDVEECEDCIKSLFY